MKKMKNNKEQVETLSKKRILLISNFPAPYFVDYVIELSKYFAIRVVFESHGVSHREKEWFKYVDNNNIECIYLKHKNSNNKLPCLNITKYLRQKDVERIIVCNPASPTGVVALTYCRRKKIPVLLQSEGGFQGKGNGFKERLKKYIMEKSIGFLTGMNSSNDYFLKYGATEDKLMHYPFTSLKTSEIETNIVTLEEKERIKRELNIVEQNVVLYVGRFIEIKGINQTIQACGNLPENTGVYFIGGELNEKMQSLVKQANVKNLHTIKFIKSDLLKKYYKASDVFIMMSQGDTWGLVINEAMANGLPIITTTSCVAGNELINQGENGFLVNKNDYLKANHYINYLLNNPDERIKMATNNIKKIQPYSIENMAKTIADHINSTFKY